MVRLLKENACLAHETSHASLPHYLKLYLGSLLLPNLWPFVCLLCKGLMEL